jgi:RHS repeat-associated protein
VEPKTTPVTGDKKLMYAYDYMGRRVRKRVYNYSGGWQLQSDRRFVWDDCNLVMFLDGQNENTIVRKQVWGLDLAGLSGATSRDRQGAVLHGAGGIGGLLACVETQGTQQGSYWYLYDGNGNVGQVLSATDQSLVARYEYDPYGNAIVAEGPYATANPYRFSTKQWDGNIGLSYWGYRYYSPTTGRWLSRDPIEETDGYDLYAYVANDPENMRDPTGQCTLYASMSYETTDWIGCICKYKRPKGSWFLAYANVYSHHDCECLRVGYLWGRILCSNEWVCKVTSRRCDCPDGYIPLLALLPKAHRRKERCRK